MRRWIAFGLLWVGFGILGPGQAAAGAVRVTLPVGTKAKELGPGHYRFLLPDGKSLEEKNFNAGTGILGNCGLFDPAGKKLSGGKSGRIVGGPAAQVAPAGGAAQIDDEVTWLRAGGKGVPSSRGRRTGRPGPAHAGRGEGNVRPADPGALPAVRARAAIATGKTAEKPGSGNPG